MTRGPESVPQPWSCEDAARAVLDADSFVPLDAQSAGAVVAGTARVDGIPVWCARVGPGGTRGAIGVAEADALGRTFERAASGTEPLLLLLESAGARLDQGLPGLAAFRALFRSALRAKFAGLRLCAVVGPVCYGGASLLAALAQRRYYLPSSRFGMSGPIVIEAMSGCAELDPTDSAAVEGLLGGDARARVGGETDICRTDLAGLRRALREGLVAPTEPPLPAFEADHRRLLRRLAAAAIELPRTPRPAGAVLHASLERLFGGGFEAVIGDGVVRGVRVLAGREVSVIGLAQGAPLSAPAAWMLAESIVTSVRAQPQRPIVIVCDSPGHAAARADESVLLSVYVAHVAEALHWARLRGVACIGLILGQCAGGMYAALASAVQPVLALPGAEIRPLARSALARVLGKAPPDAPALGECEALGVIDRAATDGHAVRAVTEALGLPLG